MKIWLKIFLLCLLAFLVLVSPRLLLASINSDKIVSLDDLPELDQIILLGAHLNESGAPTPILEERLLAGIELFESGAAEVIVLSNTQPALQVMNDTVLEAGVDPAYILLDDEAVRTPDSCDQLQEGDRVLLVSQGFHLPRAIYQCAKYNVIAYGFPAETSSHVDRESLGSFLTFKIRGFRFLRESALSWLAVLGIYR